MQIVKELIIPAGYFIHNTRCVRVDAFLLGGDYNGPMEEFIPNYISVSNNCRIAIQKVINEMRVIFLYLLRIFFASAVKDLKF